jgi:hypothetical protein
MKLLELISLNKEVIMLLFTMSHTHYLCFTHRLIYYWLLHSINFSISVMHSFLIQQSLSVWIIISGVRSDNYCLTTTMAGLTSHLILIVILIDSIISLPLNYFSQEMSDMVGREDLAKGTLSFFPWKWLSNYWYDFVWEFVSPCYSLQVACIKNKTKLRNRVTNPTIL